VAYCLQLLEGTKLHDVFHVGLLKQFHGDPPSSPAPPPPIRHGHACLQPEAVLKCHLAHGQREVLVKWKGNTAADTSWMDLDDFCHVYPAFQLTDELF
jgi:hypothetical protein